MIALNWPLIRRLGYRLLKGKGKAFLDHAESIEVIAQEEITEICPALHPDGALDHITGLSPWRSWDRETDLIRGGPDHHAPTRKIIMRDVWISGPAAYKRETKYCPGFGAERLRTAYPDGPRNLDNATLVSCFAGSLFFGPFLKDSLPQELLPESDARMITMRTKDYGHETGYRALFDLVAPPRVDRARIGRLTFFEDIGQNRHKAGRYDILRQRLRNALRGKEKAPQPVYLKRGATGEKRLIQNEAALEACLAKNGFDIVEPARLSPAEIAERTLDAPLVISVEGSHISHVAYSMAKDGTLLVIQPPDRFAMAFKEFTDRNGIRFAFVVGRPDGDRFVVDIAELQHFLDRLS